MLCLTLIKAVVAEHRKDCWFNLTIQSDVTNDVVVTINAKTVSVKPGGDSAIVAWVSGGYIWVTKVTEKVRSNHPFMPRLNC